MSKHTSCLPDCTNKCQSTQHGDSITAAITKRSISDSDLCAYLAYTCCCCESVKDSHGRTALHVAASCGRTDLVRWLVENRHANINTRDKESGYTALHRSIFYGKIDTVVELIKVGANLGLQDANGLTFLEHAMVDRFCPELSMDSGELFTWGTNSNNSLGSQQPRTVPEAMDIFHKEYPNENVKTILINQFHCVILTDSESLAEAKEKAAKGNSNEQNTEVGRGFRTSKPTDYFSPAEEEERFQEKIRRKGLPKKGFSANGLGVQDKTLEEDYQAAFMKHLIHPKSVDVLEESLSEVFDEREKEKETDLTTIRRKEVRNNIEDIFDKSDAENNTNTVNSALNESETTLQFTESSGKGVIVPCVSGDAVDQTSLPSTSSISASVIPDSDMISMNRKLDVIHKMMAKMSLDMNQLHEKMDGVFPDSKKDEDDALPFSFPLKTLTEIEKLEEFIKAKEENKMKYMRYLKGIGGHDFRDHILRICRSLFTNVLGETCSWLGRKQNFAVGHLEMTNIAYGAVYSCGHGQGGRLGLGIQHTEVIPKQIKFQALSNIPHTNERIQVVSCNIGIDHSLFLTSIGVLYSCGLNKHRVLGIAPPPAELLVPKPLKPLTDELKCVATGNYHSLAWSSTGLFTWGLNAGQLGHQLNNALDDKYILTPKRVQCINSKENTIKLVCASTGATVVYTEKGDVYVLHEYQCRKIASRQLNLVEMCVIGGKLNHTLDPDLSNKNRDLTVAVLTNTGNLMVWQESDTVLRRCIFSINRALSIKQISININHLIFVTNDGEAFSGEIKPRKKKIISIVEKNKSSKSEFHKFLEKDECISVKLQKIPRIHRALNIHSDPKGHNFGIIQVRPYNIFGFCDISESTMFENMQDLLEGADFNDDITDLVITVGERKFFTHKYIMASRSQYFAKLFEKNLGKSLELKDYNPDIFEQFLLYIYTRSTELIKVGELKSENLRRLCKRPQEAKEEIIDEVIDENKSAFECYSRTNPSVEKEKYEAKLDNPVRMLHVMAKRFEVSDLQKILSNLDMNKYVVKIKKDSKEMKLPPIVFDRNAFQELCDVEIFVRDDRVIKAHKCILTARLDYFNSMFSSRWKGGETSKITMPFAKGVVEALLEFLYTDSLDQLTERDVDQLFKIIILADQFFVTILKDQCEHILSQLITIKNAIQLLTFADAYNAETLKEICFEFIQQNMATFLEMRLLDDVEPDLLKELSEFFQVKHRLDCRVITPYSTAVSDDEIFQISSLCPVDITEKKNKVNKEKQRVSSRRRVRSHKNSSSEKVLSQSLENESTLLSTSFPSEILKVENLDDHRMTTRFKAILTANEIGMNEETEENFVKLSKKTNGEDLSNSFVDSFEFPLLNSPPKPSGFHNKTPHKSEIKHKAVKLSQKQRKRLSSESSNQVIIESPPKAESPKNPWKIIQDPVSPVNTPGNDNIESIISSERKQKENLVKIKSKQLSFTQLEDKAIDELKRFYSADDIEDEVIVIERVSMGAVALPVWVPKTK